MAVGVDAPSAVAEYINRMTQPGDTVLVWGNEVWINVDPIVNLLQDIHINMRCLCLDIQIAKRFCHFCRR